jgi:hypothetical protein
MTHEPTEYVLSTKRTGDGRKVWICPECGKPVHGETPGRPCTGRAEVVIAGNLACIHRLEKVGTVPCGVCPTTNQPKQASVYLCRAEGGRACVLYAVGTGPEQHIHGVLPVVCTTCPIRTPPVNTEG